MIVVLTLVAAGSLGQAPADLPAPDAGAVEMAPPPAPAPPAEPPKPPEVKPAPVEVVPAPAPPPTAPHAASEKASLLEIVWGSGAVLGADAIAAGLAVGFIALDYHLNGDHASNVAVALLLAGALEFAFAPGIAAWAIGKSDAPGSIGRAVGYAFLAGLGRFLVFTPLEFFLASAGSGVTSALVAIVVVSYVLHLATLPEAAYFGYHGVEEAPPSPPPARTQAEGAMPVGLSVVALRW